MAVPPSLRRLILLLLVAGGGGATAAAFELEEATIDSIHCAFAAGELTSRGLVELYLRRIASVDPALHAVIELDPDGALAAADRADAATRIVPAAALPPLHGVPVLLKDNIASKGSLNATAGSLAMVGSSSARDAGVVERLRRAGAVVLGTSSLSEWCNFRGPGIPAGWSARGGQGTNPYVPSATPCSSSSGSAIAAAANLAAVTIGTETDGSIMCPSSYNSVVGIKPTVGLTSRAGVIIISPRMDTVGPITRTVADAVHVLEAIVGYDPRDAEATRIASHYVPDDGYRKFLNTDGLRGKRLGILKKDFFHFPSGSVQEKVFGQHFDIMSKMGAILVDNIEIPSMNVINDAVQSGERALMLAEFKLSLNSYLSELATSPVRSLSDIIDFNNKHPSQERMAEFGQEYLLRSEATNGIGPTEERAIAKLNKLCKRGLEKVMQDNQLDAIVAPGASAHSLLALGGYPAITVPAGYAANGVPFAICFGGLRGSEPKLIEIAHSFEQATKVRKPPSLQHSAIRTCNYGDESGHFFCSLYNFQL
ncbi:probable amidase At4g34880 [Phragmites australis]|uniref:probable amidase At4g34880 n=1 Tax=Phragmites australis TaxID=29695 RepID=UPI002D79511E|nr:probable amidase At4g34880 [Phragmites australis]